MVTVVHRSLRFGVAGSAYLCRTIPILAESGRDGPRSAQASAGDLSAPVL